MIELITGLPGNSKTLYAISYVREWSKKDNRQVFYAGVPLTEKGVDELGWLPIEADRWMDAPPNSIVIIDECQQVFRNRSLGQIPPPHVQALETHRHRGIDLVLITQHPSFIDPSVRRLTGRHKHMVRVFGMEASTIHEWSSVRDNCDKPAARKDSEKTKWKFDRSIYPLYKSAEVHTVKRTIPKRVVVVLAAPVAVVIAAWLVYTIMLRDRLASNTPDAPTSPSVTPTAPAAPPSGYLRMMDRVDPVAEAREYAARRTPRVAGLPHTAPVYDQVMQPVTAPVPVACIATADRCQCYTQQGTRMPSVPDDVCRDVAEFGYFQDWADRSAASMAALDRRGEPLPFSGADTRDVAVREDRTRVQRVATMNCDGYGVHGKRTC